MKLVSFLDSLGGQPVAITAVTASELLHRCHRATNAGARAKRFAYVDTLLDSIPVAPFGLAEARRHAERCALLARRGTMIGPHDLLIAATALPRGDSLATLNQREFKRARGLISCIP